MARSSSDRRDVVVVGLGAMGSAVSVELVRRGLRVVGLDARHPPHEQGSTHGDTRITRLAIGEGSEYVPFVRRSHELWRRIERESGASLLHQTGGLVAQHRRGVAGLAGRSGSAAGLGACYGFRRHCSPHSWTAGCVSVHDARPREGVARRRCPIVTGYSRVGSPGRAGSR